MEKNIRWKDAADLVSLDQTVSEPVNELPEEELEYKLEDLADE